VKIDPFGGEVEQNVIVVSGAELEARAGQSFIQILYVFPAGTKTLMELEALIVPINVNADWSEANPSSATYILNKPAFITLDELCLPRPSAIRSKNRSRKTSLQ
jgi:hypothetical protein